METDRSVVCRGTAQQRPRGQKGWCRLGSPMCLCGSELQTLSGVEVTRVDLFL